MGGLGSSPPKLAPGTMLGRYKILLMSSFLELGHMKGTTKRQKSIYSQFI